MNARHHERPWLEALKRLQQRATALADEATAADTTPGADDAKTTKVADAPSDIAWRVTVLRPQVPARGPIPRLSVRTDASTVRGRGRCGMCGDVLPEGRKFRCGQCVRALEVVLNEVREGMT